ncbi:MAG: FecR family protein [Methylococcaceae bacterium]|nr:FecR family protein [Methylococcaceae bacterium]
MPSSPEQKPELSVALDEAAAWLARLQSSQVKPGDYQSFEQWRTASPEHDQAYAQVTQLWQSPVLDAALSRYAAIVPRPRSYRRHWLAAACVLFICGWGIHTLGLIDRWQADYVTATGEQRTVSLADGSTVTLNTDSAIQVNNSEGHRGVRLLRGEAFFNVTPDKAKPFIVNAEANTVRVVGTQFAVSTGDRTQVAVASGIVLCANGRGDQTQLTAGQQTLMDDRQASLALAIYDSQAFAWTKGRMAFKNRSLGEVIAELDRYQPGRIVIANSKITQTRVSGNYKLQDIPAVVNSLANIVGAKVTMLSPYLTVLR